MFVIILTGIMEPSSDNSNITVNEFASSVQLMCTLNVDIPSSVEVTWLYNGSTIVTTPHNKVTQTGNAAILQIGDLQLSDAGVYQCVFNDSINEWMLRRNISLIITGMFIC